MSIIKSDAQSEKSLDFSALDFVGMSQIESFIRVGQGFDFVNVPVLLKLGVNLVEGHRGIHMSRLFQLHMEQILNQNLTVSLIHNFLQKLILSQEGHSTRAISEFKFQFPVITQSLKSSLPGSRSYPVEVYSVLQNNQYKMQFQFQIIYSSTCPQSVKLSKEFLNQQYDSETIQEWLKSGTQFPATPHAQRSVMTIQVQSSIFLGSVDQLILKMIHRVESTLKTAVQTAVKKSDEMEFARLNGENPMFCEDAVRRVAVAIQSEKEIEGFKIKTEHQESLHSHNAAAEITSNFVNF